MTHKHTHSAFSAGDRTPPPPLLSQIPITRHATRPLRNNSGFFCYFCSFPVFPCYFVLFCVVFCYFGVIPHAMRTQCKNLALNPGYGPFSQVCCPKTGFFLTHPQGTQKASKRCKGIHIIKRCGIKRCGAIPWDMVWAVNSGEGFIGQPNVAKGCRCLKGHAMGYGLRNE